MLLPVQAPPTIRNRNFSTTKICSKIAGLVLSEFMEEDIEDLEGLDSYEDFGGYEDFDGFDE